jgi:BlaI family penicillinase repressor
MDLKQGDLENIILNALWDLEGDGNERIFVGDIQEKIKSVKKKWAYTTVKTVLDRLVDKEIAIREKDGKKYLYRSVVNRDEAGILALKKVVRQYFKNDVNELVDCLNRMQTPAKIIVERKNAAHQQEEVLKELASR